MHIINYNLNLFFYFYFVEWKIYFVEIKISYRYVVRTHSTNFPLHFNLCARTEETLKEIRNTEEIYLFQGKR